MTLQFSDLVLFPNNSNYREDLRPQSIPVTATYAVPTSNSLIAYGVWATRWVLWGPLTEGRITHLHIVLRIE
jgi:hypothetical protein